MKMNMKKIISWGMMLAAAFTLTNCAKEIDAPVQEPESVGYPFEIVASTVDTKTVYDGIHTQWAEGDKINLFHAVGETTDYVNNNAFTVSDLAEGRFTGNLAGELEQQEEYDWFAFYPYSSYIKTPANTSSGYMTVGSSANGVQVQKGNGSMSHIAGENYPLVGRAIAVPANSTPKMVMSHVSSLIAVNVKNTLEEPLVVENVSFNAPVEIVGTYYINFAGDITPESFTGSGDKYVSKAATLNVEEGTAIVTGQSAVFYLAVKPFVAKANDKLVVTVNGYAKELTMTKDVTFSAGKIKTLNFAYDYVAPAGEQTVTFDFTSADELTELGIDLPDTGAGTNVPTLNKGQVTMVPAGGSTATRVWNASGSYELRAYKNATLTFSVPSGYVITDVKLDGTETTSISASVMPSNPVVLTVDADADTRKISTITVKYVEGEVEMVPLEMTTVSCSNPAPNSLTFTWAEVPGAVGYKVSLDGGLTYGDVQNETSYTWENLEPETEYTLYVKAIGNGVNTSDSDAVSCTAKTDAEPVGVEEIELVIDLTKQGYSNQQEVSSVSKNPIDVVFNKGSNSNAPKYYTSGTAVRLYGGGYFTVSSDKTIVKVVITFGSSDGTNEITTDSGAYSNGTWTGNANSVKFSIGGTSGNRRIQKITVTYQKAVGEVILVSRELKFSSSEVSATMGQAFTAPTLSGVTSDVTSDVTYTSSNTDVATVDAKTGVVTLVAVGTTTITASAPATAEYEAGTASYTLTVNPASSVGTTKTFTVKSDDIVNNSAYQAYSKTIDGRDWVITCGGNQKSVGVNSSNRSKCNLSNTNYKKYAVSPVTTSSTAAAFASTTKLENVSKISYAKLSGGSNQGNTKIYILYSQDGTTFSQISLTSGTQGGTINTSSGGTFEFAECSGYFAVVFAATNTSGNWRLDDVNLTFTYSE